MSLEPSVHRVTRDWYADMRRRDILGWHETELVDGIVYDQEARSQRVIDARHWLRHQVDRAWRQNLADNEVRAVTLLSISLEMGSASLWCPAVTVVEMIAGDDFEQGRTARLATYTPDMVDFVAEVSLAPPTKHLNRKVWAYAENGIPECWLLLLGAQDTLVRHRVADGDRFLLVETFAVDDYQSFDVASMLTI
jgi:hypothetical protein